MGSFYTEKAPLLHTEPRCSDPPTHSRRPRWRSRLALGVGEGQKLTRCIDSPVQRRGAVSNEAKLGSLFYTGKSTPPSKLMTTWRNILQLAGFEL
jgi:hypothetical protein